MKITSLLALSALMTIGANAQTVLYSQNFQTGGTDPLVGYGVASSTRTASFRLDNDATWGFTGGTGSRTLTVNSNDAIGVVTFAPITLLNGYTMTISFDTWNVFGTGAAGSVTFNGNTVGSTFTTTHQTKQTITRTFTNTTGSNITSGFAIAHPSGNIAIDNILVTVPEPSAALLGAFGALALLRRRRA